MDSKGSKPNYGSIDNRRYTNRSNPFDDILDEPMNIRNQGGIGSNSDVKECVSGDIITINSSASGLEKSLKVIGTSKDTPQLREKIHESELTTNKVIKRTAASLRHLASLCTRSDRTERLQCERLTGDFKTAVQRYNSLQKKVADKVKATKILRPDPAAADLIGWNEGGTDTGPTTDQQQRQLLLQEQQHDEDLLMLQERETQIQQLEGDIIDMNDIFRQLGSLVHEQGEVIDTIEANVESAGANVEGGNEQLLKAAIYQSKARKKKCCLLILLLVVIAIIILIIVLSVKFK